MIQGVISPLPGRERVNYLVKRRLVSGVVLDEAAFEQKVGQCRRHLQNHRESRIKDGPPASALELGTGMYPIVPIGLWLAGMEHVVTSTSTLSSMSKGHAACSSATPQRSSPGGCGGSCRRSLPGAPKR
jgi:hypothetical protein